MQGPWKEKFHGCYHGHTPCCNNRKTNTENGVIEIGACLHWIQYMGTMYMYVFDCRKTTRAAVILLPLLGISWLFGLLAVDKHTVIFMYLFVIFNSMQVGRVKPYTYCRNRGLYSLVWGFDCSKGLSIKSPLNPNTEIYFMGWGSSARNLVFKVVL